MPGDRTALIWTLRGLGVVALVLSVPQLITLGMIAAGIRGERLKRCLWRLMRRCRLPRHCWSYVPLRLQQF